MMALHNLHVLLLKKKGITQSDATGDGTGYSLTVKNNYESYAQELKDKAKENRNEQYSRKYSISIIINNVIDDFWFLINFWFNAI